jgi:hypothetical protein
MTQFRFVVLPKNRGEKLSQLYQFLMGAVHL